MKSNEKETMRLMWHDEKNKIITGKTFNQITTKDNSIYLWKCPYENTSCPLNHKSPKQIYQAIYNGAPLCSYCKGDCSTKNLQEFASDKLKRYWHFERNSAIGIFPDKVALKSNNMIFVKCNEHNWGIEEEKKQRIADFAKHVSCPQCNGKQATTKNNLKLMFPTLAEELHPAFNANLILPSSSNEYPWFCKLCDVYYIKAVYLRTSQHQGCPVHNSMHKFSKTEKLILQIFNNILGGFSKHHFTNKKWLNGHPVEVDCYKKTLKIAIEYDGYHHGKKVKSDQAKNDMLYNHPDISLFIRIRQIGLKGLVYHDNQIGIECGLHESSYNFLISPLREAIKIIVRTFNLPINIYTEKEMKKLIRATLPKIHANSNYPSKGGSFGEYAPGLVRYLGSQNKDSYNVTKGSNHVFNNVTCPNCGNLFSNHKSKAKILIKSRGLCNACLHIVKDIHNEKSPLVRWNKRNIY